jgi:hypothetical protein
MTGADIAMDGAIVAAAVVLAFFASDFWRWAATVLGRGFREEDEVVLFARMVATAVLTGVVAKLILFPTGALEAVPLWGRLLAMGAGMLAFVLRGRSVWAAIGVGQASLLAVAYLTS